MYTGTWDGLYTVTVTLTATGAFLESLSGQSLAALVPMAQQALAQGIGGPAVASALTLVADTGMAGYALKTTGTAPFNVLTWTAPADGKLHTAAIYLMLDVSSAMTGGELAAALTPFAGGRNWASQVSQPSLAAALWSGNGSNSQFATTITVPSGGTVSLQQFTLLTGGAATAYAQIWAA